MQIAIGNNYYSLKELSWEEKQEIPLSMLSKYGDWTWDFSKEYPQYEKGLLRFKYKTFQLDDVSYADELVESAKDLMLSLEKYPSNPPLRITTLSDYFSQSLKPLIIWMKENYIRNFNELRRIDADNYLQSKMIEIEQSELVGKQKRLVKYAQVFRFMIQEHEKLKYPINFDPFESLTASQFACRTFKRHENRKFKRLSDEDAKALLEKSKQLIKTAPGIKNILNEWQRRYRHLPDNKKNMHLKNEFWKGKFLNDYNELMRKMTETLTACFYIIGLFSGMRIGEILNLTVDCVGFWEFDDGERLYYLKGLSTKTFKIKKQVKWPVNEIAVDAVNVLNGLYSGFRKNTNKLFISRKENSTAMPKCNMGRHLKDFIAKYGVTEDKNFHSHRLRYTYARVMIDLGMNLGELSWQFKHRSLKMTAHYGDPDLHEFIERENLKYSKDIWVEKLEDKGPVVGGGSREFKKLQAEFKGFTSLEEKERFVKKLAARMHVCNSGVALCIYDLQTKKMANCISGGINGGCNPVQCPNSTVPKTLFCKIYEDLLMQNKAQFVAATGRPHHQAVYKDQIGMIEKIMNQWEQDG